MDDTHMGTASGCSGSENTGDDVVFNQSYKICNIIDRGSYGIVHEGLRIVDQTPVVVKVIQMKDIPQWEEVDGVPTPLEVIILRKLRHIPGVVKLIESFDCGTKYMIVMEKLEDPISLEDHVVQGTLLTESNSPKYFVQIITTLIACYEAGIVHRDIKPGNILLDRSTDQLYLIDFGSAAYLKNEPFSGIVGAFPYCAPECLSTKKYYGESSTVWAIGAVFYELLIGEVPFHSTPDTCKKELTFYKKLSETCKNFIGRCLKKKIESRPTLQSLLYDPFLCNNQPETMEH